MFKKQENIVGLKKQILFHKNEDIHENKNFDGW